MERISRLQQAASEYARRRDRWIRVRMSIVGMGLIVGFGVVVGRAMDLHLREQPSLKWVASKQYRAVIPTAPRRGKILDQKGRELALDLPVHSLYVDPRGVRDSEGTLAALQRVLPLGADAKLIRRRLAEHRKFVWIKRRVEPSVAEQVRLLKLPGMHSVEETRRFYPNGALASQVLGAVGYDAEALGGVELAYDRHLASEGGQVVYQRDARGRMFYTSPSADPSNARRAAMGRGVPANAGDQRMVADLELTIDKMIQHYAETALVNAVAAANAPSGVAVVVEVETGRVLAMASMPSFDPNEYGRYNQARWRNRAITDTYEPGSTFKVFIAAAALAAGMDPERRFDCHRGRIKIGDAVLHDHDPYGILSLNDIIKVSSNLGALQVAQAVGRDRFAAMIRAFGIGRPTGIDFPGEVGGVLRDPATWQPVEMATIAFGQGVTATPLQMAMAFAAIANGGRLMQPYLVERIRREDGVLLREGRPRIVGRPIPPETARQLTAMLARVVEKGGTGTKAASSAYAVAGKTGTAQKVAEGSGRYAAGKYFASFVGFAPASAPRIAVYVGIDEPKGGHFGGAVAAPVFKEIVEASLPYLGVPSQNGALFVAAPAEPRPVPARSIAPAAAPSETAAPASIVAASEGFAPVNATTLGVPSLVGLPMREVLRRAGEAGVQVEVQGTGLAVAQTPPAGGKVAHGGAVAVRFALP
ncbi:MAG: serine hydrolase [Deltaproteobacteria bacterium]|nr:serine hydrolase [Deltaproteobacteria bacterium]